MFTRTKNSGFGRRGATLAQALVFILVFAGCATLAMFLQHAKLKKMERERPYQGGYFLPKAEFAKLLAFGYDAVLADFYYLRAIQSFGGKWKLVVKDYSSIVDYFDTLTELDPQFIEVYEYGSMILNEEGGLPDAAIALNRKGWLKNLWNYRPSYLNAYICWWELRRPLDTKLWATLSSKVPGCPEFVGRIVNHIDKEMGQYSAAAERWINDYVRGIERGDDYLMTIARGQLVDIADKWHKKNLSNAVRKFREERERLPLTIQELVDGGYLRDYEGIDYHALRRRLEAWASLGLLPPDALRVASAEAFVKKSGAPVPPQGEDSRRHFYLLRRDHRDETRDALFENEQLVWSSEEAAESAAAYLSYLRMLLRQRFKETGSWPAAIEDLKDENGEPVRVYDPVAGTWNYNPETGELKSPSFPEL
jgi:hypothetical protein